MITKLKQLTFILILTISSLSYAQEIKRFYYDDGTIKQIGAFNSDGNATGEWKFYDQNGFLTEVGDYRDGKATGEWKLYEKNVFLEFNGYLKAVGNYDKGEKIGEWKIYGDINVSSIRNFSTSTLAMYYRGALYSKGKLDDNGKKTGEWKEYHDNGQLESKGNYTENDENKTGKWSFYHKNGTLDKEKDFLNGKLQSEVTIDENSGTTEKIIYYPSGEIKTKLQYRTPDDLLNVIVSKGPNGEDLDYGSLKDGNGTYKEYDIEGKLINILTVKDGKVITKENKAKTTKFYGLLFKERDSISVNLNLDDYKTFGELLDRAEQLGCTERIPKITLEGAEEVRKIYFIPTCDKKKDRPLIKQKNIIQIVNDEVNTHYDNNYHALDSLKSITARNIKNYGKIENLSDSPEELFFSIEYGLDANPKRLKNTLLQLTKVFDEVGGKTNLRIILNEVMMPPPSPAPKRIEIKKKSVAELQSDATSTFRRYQNSMQMEGMGYTQFTITSTSSNFYQILFTGKALEGEEGYVYDELSISAYVNFADIDDIYIEDNKVFIMSDDDKFVINIRYPDGKVETQYAYDFEIKLKEKNSREKVYNAVKTLMKYPRK